jgi:DNA polymerase
MELSTYGGKLCENADQGYSSCLLRGGMLNLEVAGYPAIGTVHDEIIMEVPKGFGSLEEAAALMCKQAKHAAGLPLRAEGKRQEYYWK